MNNRDIFGLRHRSLFFKVIGGLGVLVLAVMGANYAYQSSVAHRKGMKGFEDQAGAISDLMLAALENPMLRNDVSTVRDIVKSIHGRKGIEEVFIVSADKKVAVTSDESLLGRVMEWSDPQCIVCHVRSDKASIRSVILSKEDGIRTFRNVMPILNKPACYECHDASSRILGVMIADLSMSAFDSESRRSQAKLAIASGVTVLFMALFTWILLNRAVLNKVKSFVTAIKGIDEQGRIPKVELDAMDEFGMLAGSFNGMSTRVGSMMDDLRNLVTNIDLSVHQLNASAGQIKTSAREQAEGSIEQVSSVQEALTTADEIAAASRQIATNAHDVDKLAEKALESCISSAEIVSNATKGMEDVRDHVNKVAQGMLELGSRSQQIGNVTQIIEEINEQTALLSLNASIEAAGAGEEGRRFGVVATEIRRLATGTYDAAKQIKALIEEIQRSTTAAVMQVEESTKAVENWSGYISKVGETFRHIEFLVTSASQATGEIKLTTEQQTKACEQMAEAIADIKQVAENVSDGSKETENAITSLSDIAENLVQLVQGHSSAINQ